MSQPISRSAAIKLIAGLFAAGVVPAVASAQSYPDPGGQNFVGPRLLLPLNLGSFDAIQVIYSGQAIEITPQDIWIALTGSLPSYPPIGQ